MGWRIADGYSADLSWEYRDASLRFLTALHGELEWQPTWKICLDTVHYRLGTLLATEFIRSHIAPNVKNQVRNSATSCTLVVPECSLSMSASRMKPGIY